VISFVRFHPVFALAAARIHGAVERCGGILAVSKPWSAMMANRPDLPPPHRETVRGDERLTVHVIALADGRFGYRAECRYEADDGTIRDDYTDAETFADADEAMAAGIVKARQLAGIDAPEA
jgi:hypothetical protein